MNEIIQKILNERLSVELRYENLRKFKKTKKFEDLDKQMKQMINTQEAIMKSYIEILTLRYMYLKRG